MEQEVQTKGGSAKHISGSWEFANGFLVLKPCLEVRSQIEGARAEGCAQGVEVTLSGNVEIATDSDHGLAYEKVKGR
jgi:hypothetical protein